MDGIYEITLNTPMGGMKRKSNIKIKWRKLKWNFRNNGDEK